MNFIPHCSPAMVESCTGFTVEVIDEFCRVFEITGEKVADLVLGLTMMHTDCSNEQLAVYAFAMLMVHIPTSTIMDRVIKILQNVFKKPMLNREGDRFKIADTLLGNITCICDGTSVMKRAPDSDFGFKGKCDNYQVFSTLDGELMTYAGPFLGRLTDARNFVEDPADHERTMRCLPEYVTHLTMVHFEEEVIAMDGIYKANVHSMVPYENVAVVVPPGTPAFQHEHRSKQVWNYVFSLRRARIERKFGQLDRHRFFHYTLRSTSMVALMFRAMWNAELIKRRLDGASLNYSDELCDGRLLGRQWGQVCACHWAGMWYAGGAKRRQFLRYRDILRDAYVANHGLVARVSRPSQHESLADKREREDNRTLAEVVGLVEPVLYFY